ncbi:MAG TPA: hypothetical protein VIU16_02405, partial [Gaiellaceae bacterium]
PWPGFDVDVAGIALALGCAARRVASPDELPAVLGEALAGLAERDEPLLLEVAVDPDPEFNP